MSGSRRLRAFVAKALICSWALGAPAAGIAAKLALLVGVGQYPGLSSELQLQAPANDVRLMRQVLQRWGFEAARIEVLADGVDGARLPTHANIVAQLRALASRARSGDMVYLHFSGHGSLQWIAEPAPAGARVQGHWQPIFLPRDVPAWDGKVGGPVANALADVELRRLVDDINDTGAFVFVVVDACHSARLVRGALPGSDATRLRVRQVPPGVLAERGDAPPAVRPQWTADGPPTASGHRGRAVYFYAAQSIELEAMPPLEGRGASSWHGLFSWHLAQALSQGQTMSYRQLGQHVLSRYDLLPDAMATPSFVGDGLDQAVFDQQTVLLEQWPIEHGRNGLAVAGGALTGLAPGALLAILADPAAPATRDALDAPQGTLGYARVSAVEASQAALEPAAWRGWPALPPNSVPAGAWARLMVNPPSYTLKVAVERGACAADCAASHALEQLRREGIPGVDARWVAAPEVADVHLIATGQGIRLLLPGESVSDAAAWGVAQPAADPSLALEVMAQQTAAALHRVARVRNLLRLASAMPASGQAGDLRFTLRSHPANDAAAVSTVVPERMASLHPGDHLLLDGINQGADPLDVAVFWLGADQSVQQLYPADSRGSARLEPGAAMPAGRWAVDPKTSGVERLLVITLPMHRGAEERSFRFLEQSPLMRLRGASDPELQALADACFGDYATRGAAAPAIPADRLTLTLFTFDIGS